VKYQERDSMDAGLTGLRVVEVSHPEGDGCSAAAATKLMADLGATVVKLEPPSGDPARHLGPWLHGQPSLETSGTFLALNPGKRSVVVDLTTAQGQETLDRFADECDILVHNAPPKAMAVSGLDYARLAARNPKLVMLSITPFGLFGPHRDYAAAELTMIHGSGLAWLCPDDSAHPDRPPLFFHGHHAFLQAGLHGAVAAMSAHLAALASGVGEHVDLSVQETVGMLLGRHFPSWTYAGQVESRLTFNITVPSNLYPCRDGDLFLIAVEEDQWARLVELMGKPDWALTPEMATRESRGANRDYVIQHVSEWTRTWAAEELFHACQKARVGAAPVYRMEQVAHDRHLTERGAFVPHEHPQAGQISLPGSPYQLSEPWWSLRSPAPMLGEANDASAEPVGPGLFFTTPRSEQVPLGFGKSHRSAAGAGGAALPLAGIRVLDLSWVWAGPHATLMLAHLGAEVLKVESSSRPDLARRIAVFPPGVEPGLNRSGYFNSVNLGKKSLALNLGNPEGLALVKKLAARSDVIISNFATGVMDRLGLGAAELHKYRPELVVATISAFGQTGPYKQYTGYGPLIPPIAGLCASTGYEEDGLPRSVRNAYADPNAGIYTAFAIVAALRARKADEPGLVIDTSLWEPLLSTGCEGWMGHVLGNPPLKPQGNHDSRWAPHNVYRCPGEDRWVAIAVQTDSQWQNLCGAIGRLDLAADARFASATDRKRHEAELDRVLSEWCAPRDRWEVTRLLQEHGVPAFPSMDSRDLTEDEHLRARGYFATFDHPEVGERTHIGMPWRLSARPNGVRSRSPLLGEHTDATLRDLLALSKTELKALRERGAIE
jgi:crotonobetainyl-CoA:carnitine CoA-transferase CaiB-like acyl-CoA transferase